MSVSACDMQIVDSSGLHSGVSMVWESPLLGKLPIVWRPGGPGFQPMPHENIPATLQPKHGFHVYIQVFHMTFCTG